MVRRIAAAAAVVSLAALAAEGAAQDRTQPFYRDKPQTLYREGQPPVLTPPPAPAPAAPVAAPVPSLAARDAFRRAYRRAGSPRLAVFWNRVFSDGLRDMQADRRIVVKASDASASGGADKAFSARRTDRVAVKSETRRADDARASPVSEIGEFRFRTGYLQPLIKEGASVIDRAAIMRLTDAARRLADSAVPADDRQLIETAALRDHADLLIQIALSPSAESRTGAFFHVSMLEVETGRIRASFFHDGTFPEPQKAPPGKVWKTVRGGYIQVTEERPEPDRPKVDLERMGRVLAEQTMLALSRL